jgi:hypothetical protein
VHLVPSHAKCVKLIELAEGFGESADPSRVSDKDAKGSEVRKEDGKDTERIGCEI